MESSTPLANKRIVITRSKEQAVDFSRKIEQLGGTVITVPLIQFSFPKNVEEIKHELPSLVERSDVIVFTSVNGVNFFFKLFDGEGLPSVVAAVGTKTMEALQQKGIKTSIIPEKFTAEHLVEALDENVTTNASILLIQGNLARPVLREQLVSLGYNVKQMVVYENTMDEEGIGILTNVPSESADVITFTSPSTVHAFLSKVDRAHIKAKIAVIGPITKKAAEQAGLQVHICPSNDFTIDGLIDALTNYFIKEETKR